ncbi:MAG: PEP-utilizing enzyme [Nanoarchaeota archaeon]|nr:hypothetical protein [Nanoarchaeota archaeon]MBU1631973.1 hypothetical protein [Nanoarchaeota archaeon]MBU1876083.1 hypothetical protein [Nanoarchaeota archaeon]
MEWKSLLKKSLKLEKVVHRKCSVLADYFFHFGTADRERYNKILGYNHAYPTYFYIDGDIYYDLDEIAHEKKKILEKTKEDLGFFLKLSRKCEKLGNELYSLSFKIKRKNLSEKSEKELVELFGQFHDLMLDFMPFLMAPLSIQSYLENRLDKTLLELVHHNMDKYQRYHKVLISPQKYNLGFLEKTDLLRIAIDYRDKKDISKKLKAHAEKYGSMGVKYGVGKIWNEKDFLLRIKSIKNPKEELNGMLNQKEEVKKEFNKIIKEFNINSELKRLIDIIKEYVYLRTFRTDIISNSFANIFNLLNALAIKRGLNFHQINSMTGLEILNDIKVSKEILDERAKGFVITCKAVLIKKDLEYVKKHFQEFKKEKVTEIKGDIASKGIVKGVIKVVMDNTQLKKVNKRDILVAPMTTPDFVVAMEKAAAFVTDEGGILCHAAIVSREMNKPCIIGTKIATKVLKDGNYVEVNANEGIVKIIKRR